MIRIFLLTAVFSLVTASFAQNTPQVVKAVGAGIEDVVLSPLNTVSIRDVIDFNSVNKAMIELAKLNAVRGLASYPLYLVINSPGGSIDAGMTFINFAKNIRNLKTLTIFGASMASAIAQQLPGERLIIGTGTMMFHRASSQCRGSVENGEMETCLEYTKAIVQDLESKNSIRIGISIKDYKEKVVAEWWIFGDNNVRANTADRVVNLICAMNLIKLNDSGRSACPLIDVLYEE